jgi:hypothetical protein
MLSTCVGPTPRALTKLLPHPSLWAALLRRLSVVLEPLLPTKFLCLRKTQPERLDVRLDGINGNVDFQLQGIQALFNESFALCNLLCCSGISLGMEIVQRDTVYCVSQSFVGVPKRVVLSLGRSLRLAFLLGFREDPASAQ